MVLARLPGTMKRPRVLDVRWQFMNITTGTERSFDCKCMVSGFDRVKVPLENGESSLGV